jgi:hypothetical protein
MKEKIIEEKIKENLSDFEFGDEFLGTTLKAQLMLEKLIKIENILLYLFYFLSRFTECIIHTVLLVNLSSGFFFFIIFFSSKISIYF